MALNLSINKVAQLTGHNAAIFSVVPDWEKQYFLSGAGDGWVVRWDMGSPENGRLIAKIDTQIFTMCYLKGTNKVVVGNMNGGVHWVDLENADNTKNVLQHEKGVFGIYQKEKELFTIGGGGTLTRWDIEESRTTESIQLTNQSLRSLDYSSSRKEFAIGASDNSIYLVDAETLAVKEVLQKAHGNSVFAVKYHPKAPYLLSGGRDAHLNAWTLDGKISSISSQPAHWYTINSIVFHPNGHWFATGSRDRSIKIWDANNFQLLKVIDTARYGGHINSVNRLYWSDFHNYLVSCSDDRSIILWEVSG